jgi:lipoprotein-releasing system ATP-binding protein
MSSDGLYAGDVHKEYPSGELTLNVLRGIDLSVAPGESVSIAGSSGAGKSTLLHVLGGLDVPSAGSVTLGGIDMFSLDDTARSAIRNSRLGFVFQFHYLLAEFSAVENAGMPLRIMGAEAEEANRKAAEILTELGLAERLHHRPAQLSGGEQQRVAVARALVHEPDFVLADEPTGNLDQVNSKMVAGMLFGAIERCGAGFILVTHDESLAAQAEKSYLLDEGRLYPH